MAASQRTPAEKAERRRERQREYYQRNKEEQDIKSKARAARKRAAVKIVSLRKESRYWHETYHMADSRVREINQRLLTMHTEMGDLLQSVDYLQTIALQKPHSERCEEILVEVNADVSDLAADIGRIGRRFEHWKKRKESSRQERNRADREVVMRQKVLEEHTDREENALADLAAAHEPSPSENEDEDDCSSQPESPSYLAEARDRTTGHDDEGVPISESVGLADTQRADEQWRRYEQLGIAGLDPVMPGTTFGAEEEDHTTTPVHDSYTKAQLM